MLVIVTATGVAVVLAAAIAVLVAYPSRGREIPKVDWLNGAVSKAAGRLPDDVTREFVSSRH